MKSFPIRNLLLLLLLVPTGLFAQNCPCCTEENRQFDFWIGKWNVYDTTGALVGTNEIKVLQDSCVLQENWVSAKGKFTGTSYNFYDSDHHYWRQTWIDNQGGELLLFGGMENGKMVMKSDKFPCEDKDCYHQISWTPQPDGTVVQLWQVRSDSGVERVLFIGIYRRG